MLIILLLLDVAFVFGEIFLEAYHPGCKAVRRSAISCCPAAAHMAHASGTIYTQASNPPSPLAMSSLLLHRRRSTP